MPNKRLSLAASVALLSCSLVIPSAFGADEDFGKSDPNLIPKLHAASDAGEEAIARIRKPAGFKVELWAAEPMLANPVALNFDEKGRCYLVETWRLGNGVIDIRGHMDWLDDDLACRTVEDRMAMVKRKMGPNARSFGRLPDVVRLLEDTTGSGKANKSTVFAEFHDAADGIAAGVLARKGNVYLTNIPNLWLLKDANGDGHADVRKSLSYGYGIRYNFIGHDLHGPRFGPDGKLYFSIGDRAVNIERSVDGRHIENLESGCVMRCNPDGSGLEIFATGLRNPQCLAFDEYGNLFTGDNNPDYGDPARVVYVVEGGDSGWRVGYQYDHNPVGGGPWMWEHLWQVQEHSTAAYLLPPVADMGAGPSGLAYYPGTGFSHEYDRHFFECDFRGTPNGSVVHAYTMDPQGAGFKMGDLHNFVSNLLSTDIVFGPAGGVYIADWVDGWNPSGTGRIYHVTDPAAMKDPVVKQVQDLLAQGFEKRSNQELIELLGHRDQRIRQEAQFELADRGPAVAPMLVEVAAKGESQLARIHAMWGLGQIAEKAPKVLEPLVTRLVDKDPEIRAQAARVLGDHRYPGAFDAFVELLHDPSLRVRYFAAMGISKQPHTEAAAPVIAMIRENADKDVYIRHAGVMALIGINDWSAIENAAHDSSRSVRIAALLAMRRMQRPEIAMFLHDPDQQLVLEAARAINDLPITPALPQLAALLDSTSQQDYVTIREINANYRVGTLQAAATLAHYAANGEAPSRWRVAALEDLMDWATPGHRDRLTNLPRPLPDRDPRFARDAVAPALTSILHDAPNEVRVAALKLIEKLGVTDSSVLMQLLADTKVSAEVRASAIQALAAQNDTKLPQAIDTGLKDSDEHVRAAAIEAMAKLPNSTNRIASLLAKGSTLEQQAAFAALAQTPGEQSDSILLSWMDRLLSHTVPAELQLDVLEAARSRQNPQLQAKVAQYESSFSKSDPLAPYRLALEGGDAASGDRIFHLRSDASCLRCHTVHGTGGIVGPVLDGIGSKQPREYLLESIVYPNAKIAQGFESVIIKLKDGRTVTGIVKSENDRSVQLIDADGKRIRVRKDEIVARTRGQSAMPEGLDKVLSKRDLRDLVAYLASLKG